MATQITGVEVVERFDHRNSIGVDMSTIQVKLATHGALPEPPADRGERPKWERPKWTRPGNSVKFSYHCEAALPHASLRAAAGGCDQGYALGLEDLGIHEARHDGCELRRHSAALFRNFFACIRTSDRLRPGCAYSASFS